MQEFDLLYIWIKHLPESQLNKLRALKELYPERNNKPNEYTPLLIQALDMLGIQNMITDTVGLALYDYLTEA